MHIVLNSYSKNKNNLFYIFLFQLFFAISYISIHDIYHYEQWKLFPDCNDYLIQSKHDLFSFNFWFPEKTSGFSPRPFTIPLIYKLIGDDINNIVMWQKIIHFFSAFLLSFSVSFFIRKQFIKYLLSISIIVVFCWWNILGWTQLLLSESLSFSFLFIWISSLLLFLKFNNTLSFTLHLFIIILFSFTRDSWPYILIIFYFLFLILAYFVLKKNVKQSILLILFSFMIFFIQQNSIIKGERHRIPIINNIVVRIINTPYYLQYFENNGMPQSNELKNEFSGVDLTNEDNRFKIYNIYSNKNYTDLYNWIIKDGKNVYFKFLILYPSYTLMLNEPQSKMNLFYSRNLYSYTKEPVGISSNLESIFPVFSYIALLVFIVIILIRNLKNKIDYQLIFFALYISLICNSIIIYNADSLEVARHLFFNSVYVEILGIIAFCFILDSIDFFKYLNKFTKK